MTEHNPDPLAPSKPICMFRRMYLSGTSSTFQDVSENNHNEEIKRCVVCDGFDENCRAYTDTRRFAQKVYKMREDFKREREQGK